MSPSCTGGGFSDNGPSYVASDRTIRLVDVHVRGAPYHPQTQGKIERWHSIVRGRFKFSILPASRKHMRMLRQRQGTV